MRRFYTAESVTEGHPDKVCDQIADAILDECLRYDPSSRVACEVLATRGNVFVAGEISSGYEPPVFDVIRKVLDSAGVQTYPFLFHLYNIRILPEPFGSHQILAAHIRC